MKKVMKAMFTAIGAFIVFASVLTTTWVNLVNLHLLPAFFFGPLNATTIILFSIGTVITVILTIGAFLLGGVYWFAFLGIFLMKQMDASFSISAVRIARDFVLYFLFRRKPTRTLGELRLFAEKVTDRHRRALKARGLEEAVGFLDEHILLEYDASDREAV